MRTPNYSFNCRCYYQNVTGLNTKTVDFFNSTSDLEYDVIFITETWLSERVNNSEIFSTDYSVFRCDRDFVGTNLMTGGGTLIAVRSNFCAVELNMDHLRRASKSIDVVGIKINFTQTSLLAFCVYIPPSIKAVEMENFLEDFEQYVNQFDNSFKIIMCGDFNIPMFAMCNDDRYCVVLKHFCSIMNLVNYNFVKNLNNRLLDLILSNFTCDVAKDTHPLTKESVHHPALTIEFTLNNCLLDNFDYSKGEKRFDFRKADFIGLYNDLVNIEWNFLETIKDPNEACTILYENMKHLFELHVPKFQQQSRRYPPWFTPVIIQNIRKKHLARRNYKKFNTINYHNQFIHLRALIKQQIKTAYANFIQTVEGSIIQNPEKFWSFILSKKSNSRIPSQMYYNTDKFESPQGIVDAFSSFFSSVYIQSDSNTIEEYPCLLNKTILIKFISENEIIEASKKLKNKLTAGCDNIPSFFVKDCICVLAKPLSFIFNSILKSCKYPNIWKRTKLVPVFKQGESNNVSNYRPISLLCNFAKIFEIIIYNRIYSEINSAISFRQFGFMTGRSTISNLACITQFIAENLESAGQVDVIYTDLQKAFDKIDHFILLNKLNAMGFSDFLLELMKSYLIGRVQYVEYGGFTSREFVAGSGVPQGSNLGPLLFLIFINDISTKLNCYHLLFADDLKLYRQIKAKEDCVALQESLNLIADWCRQNRLVLNITKCKIVTFSRKIFKELHDYKINDISLERCNLMKDLGVLFDEKLTFNAHIHQIVNSAYRTMGYCIRNWSGFRNIQTLKTIYNSFIRCKLEYGSLIWSPYYRNSIDLLESVQRRFLKYAHLKCFGFYPERGVDQKYLLETFNYEALQVRRDCSALSYLYKLLHNATTCPEILTKVQFHVPRLCIRHSVTFHNPIPRTNLLLNSPVFVMCSVFNKISAGCDIHHDSLKKIISCFKERNSIQ